MWRGIWLTPELAFNVQHSLLPPRILPRAFPILPRLERSFGVGTYSEVGDRSLTVHFNKNSTLSLQHVSNENLQKSLSSGPKTSTGLAQFKGSAVAKSPASFPIVNMVHQIIEDIHHSIFRHWAPHRALPLLHQRCNGGCTATTGIRAVRR
ncbi:hypothetical protein BDN72DRAFT_423566 [Pluteus cervinus]|uniref:Uncharacterized protein n=1 Tax=Pluteus cervinus TaxID=181527 RepID=A0ACD3A829_9AGAR|nr:hypothetical protein BDN72DRAFT_423566 [Pluteus cervinus]